METCFLPVVEIFASLQGEGYNTGMPCVFLRLGGCDLACPWCDTAYENFESLALDAIMERMLSLPSRNAVVTGGEPFIHENLGALLERLKGGGFRIYIETNGVNAPPDQWLELIDYIAVSPKASYAELYEDERMLRRADEVRIVVDGGVGSFCAFMRRRIRARHYYLSPCEREGVFNILETVRLLGELNQATVENKWRLSLQTHKLGDFP